MDTTAPPVAGDDAATAQWFNFHEARNLKLAFDHNRILNEAFDWLLENAPL